VADEHDLSGNLARMLKAAGQAAPESKPILEVNPDHPLVQKLKYEEAKFVTGHTSCSTRPCWPKAVTWPTLAAL
jgi:HSP90 family molecular chaperone